MKSGKYIESQNIISIWLIALLFIICVFVGYSLYNQLMVTKHFKVETEMIVLLVVLVLVVSIRLNTQIDKEGIRIRFLPFVFNRLWKFEDIEEIYVREYSLFDYGGWGYRFSSKGVAYTTKGKYGIQIILKNGKRILVGTQRPDEVRLFLEQRESK